MARKRHKPDEIVMKPRQGEVLRRFGLLANALQFACERPHFLHRLLRAGIYD